MRLLVHKTDIVILALETVGSFGVWAVARHCLFDLPVPPTARNTVVKIQPSFVDAVVLVHICIKWEAP